MQFGVYQIVNALPAITGNMSKGDGQLREKLNCIIKAVWGVLLSMSQSHQPYPAEWGYWTTTAKSYSRAMMAVPSFSHTNEKWLLPFLMLTKDL